MRVLLLALALSFQAQAGIAQTACYFFSGHVTSLDRDGAGTIAGLDFTEGQPVSVAFEINFGQPGRMVLNAGDTVVVPDYAWEDLQIHYFYARLLAGTRLPEVNGGMYNGEEDVSEYLAGWSRADWRGNSGVLQGGSRDSFFRLERWDPFPGGSVLDWQVQDWQVGTPLLGRIVGMSELDYSMMTADMRLDAITFVPEPTVGSLLLLGGLCGSAGGRRRGPHRL